MGYEFRDFGQQAELNPLSLNTVINGRTLDYTYGNDGFSITTLSVSGRGNVEYNVNADEVAGRDGVFQRERRLSPRKIVVRLLIVGDSNEDYRRGMTELNATLYQTNIHALQFTDDIFHTYYGTVVRVEDEGEKTNRQIVEIEFVCNDPFKYTDLRTYTVTSASPMVLDTDLPFVAEFITVYFPTTTAASNFTLINNKTGYRISYEYPMSTTSVKIQQKRDYIGSLTVNHLSGLNIKYSDFDDLTITNGDVLWASPAPSKIEIEYRGVRL